MITDEYNESATTTENLWMQSGGYPALVLVIIRQKRPT